MSYTKRTCHKCGFRDIQPNMVQRTISVDTGSSRASFDKKAFFAATFLGDKKAGRQVHKSVFANNKRKYTRDKTVFECRSCAGGSIQRSSLGRAWNAFDVFLLRFFKTLFWMAIFIFCMNVLFKA